MSAAKTRFDGGCLSKGIWTTFDMRMVVGIKLIIPTVFWTEDFPSMKNQSGSPRADGRAFLDRGHQTLRRPKKKGCQLGNQKWREKKMREMHGKKMYKNAKK